MDIELTKVLSKRRRRVLWILVLLLVVIVAMAGWTVYHFRIEDGNLLLNKDAIQEAIVVYSVVFVFLVVGVFTAYRRFSRLLAVDLLLDRRTLTEKVNEKLAESEDRYHRLADASYEIVAISKNGRVVDVSKQIEAVYGYTQEEFKAIEFPKLVHPDDLSLVIDMMKSGDPGPYRHRGIAKDGSLLNLEVRAREISIKGEPHRLTVIRDISESVWINTQLRQAEKMKALGQLAGGVAHDFNNVLAAIVGYAELAQDEARNGSVLDYYLRQILVASDRAQNLVRQILTFTRQGHPNRQVTRLEPLVTEISELLKAVIPSSVKIETEIPSKLRPVLCDYNQIHEVLMNLATNASHAMDDLGTLTVRVNEEDLHTPLRGVAGTIAPGRYAVIEVSDTGMGIKRADMERIFEPFFTTKPVGEGTGMGLAVVLGIVQSHDGDLYVKSTKGEGTSVRVYLPSLEGEEKDKAASPEQEGVVGGNERVLFVDDEQMIVEMISNFLPPLGYRLSTTTSSEQALKWIEESPEEIDVLITDQTMPNITGLELAKAASSLNPELPIILCTGFSKAVNDESARTAGIAKLCMKPIRGREIVEAIREVLG